MRSTCLKHTIMLMSSLLSLFERDLNRLKNEMEAYRDEKKIWHIEKQIANSAGNLCLHLTGNLRHFIGSQMGDSGYIRDREAEFGSKDISRAELLKLIDITAKEVREVLSNFDDSILEVEFPVVVFKEPMTTGFFLVHLSGHLNYHLGQINYHRRLLDS